MINISGRSSTLIIYLSIYIYLSINIPLTPSHTSPGYPYTVRITTGDRLGAATNANVYVVLHGRGGESGKVWLESGQRSLLAGRTDTFEVRSPQLVSPLEQVIVGHDNSGVGPGWFLEKVHVYVCVCVCVCPIHNKKTMVSDTNSHNSHPTHPHTLTHAHLTHTHTSSQMLVECGTTGGRWLFDCHRWLCLDTGDGRIERELHPTVEGEGGGGGRRWKVHVWTSDIRGAGTDASVTLQVGQGSLRRASFWGFVGRFS